MTQAAEQMHALPAYIIETRKAPEGELGKKGSFRLIFSMRKLGNTMRKWAGQYIKARPPTTKKKKGGNIYLREPRGGRRYDMISYLYQLDRSQ